MQLNKEIGRRIETARLLMILGIVLLHLPPYVPLSEVGTDAFSFIKAFFAHGVFRAAVPVLTAISGYLVFKSALVEKPLELLQKKSSSILLPLLIWNIPLAVAVFLLQMYGVISHSFSAQLYPVNLHDWVDAVTGLYSQPINYPLNFLRDLYVVSLLSPVLLVLLRLHPAVAVSSVIALYVWNLDGMLVLRNSMYLSFTLGAILAWYKVNLQELDKYAYPLFLVFVIYCVLIVVLRIENRELLRIISPVLLWPILGRIASSSIGDVLVSKSKYSFLIFLSHAPVILIYWFVWSSPVEGWVYIIYWITAVPVAYLSAVIVFEVLEKYLPKLRRVVLGGR